MKFACSCCSCRLLLLLHLICLLLMLLPAPPNPSDSPDPSNPPDLTQASNIPACVDASRYIKFNLLRCNTWLRLIDGQPKPYIAAGEGRGGLHLHHAFAIRVSGASPERVPGIPPGLSSSQDHRFAALWTSRNVIGRIRRIRQIFFLLPFC